MSTFYNRYYFTKNNAADLDTKLWTTMTRARKFGRICVVVDEARLKCYPIIEVDYNETIFQS